MNYLSAAEMAKKWEISERSVRNYCASDRVSGAMLIGKTWAIPEDAPKPERLSKNDDGKKTFFDRLLSERKKNLKGGIYRRLQTEIAYTSLSLESFAVERALVDNIFLTNTVHSSAEALPLDSVLAIVNHFDLFDLIIDKREAALSAPFILGLHRLLYRATSYSRAIGSRIGEYRRSSADGDHAPADEIAEKMNGIISDYESKSEHSLFDILSFAVAFLSVLPFESGCGVIAKLIIFKECLRFRITPFFVDKEMNEFYNKGILKWNREPRFLINIAETLQERFCELLQSVGIDSCDF